MYITYMGNKLNNKKGENMSKSAHDVFKAPVSKEDLVIAWHTVGFDKYIQNIKRNVRHTCRSIL